MGSSKLKFTDIHRKRKEPPEKKERVSVSKKKRTFRVSFARGVFVSFLILAFGVALTLHFFFAKASVSLWPITRSLAMQEMVKVSGRDLAVDVSQKIIPAKVLQQEKSATKLYPATGSIAKESKAQGTIRVFNNQSKTQILVANTRFISEDGKLFRSGLRISIPAGGFLDVSVTSAETGEEYNIGPSNFSLPGLAGSALYTLIYGKSLQPMTGGSKSATSQVTEQDIREAQRSLEQDLLQLAKADILKRAIPPFVIEEKSFEVRVIDSFSSVKAGAELAQFNVTAKVKVEALMFQSGDLESLVLQIARERISEGEEVNEQSLQVSYAPKAFHPETQILDVDLKAGVNAYQTSDLAEIVSNIQGLKKNRAEGLLQSVPTIARFQVNLWPFWTRSVPKNAEKIQLHLLLD